MTQKELEKMVPRLRSEALTTAERFFGKGEDAAEDVAQEVLMRLWLRCDQLRSCEVEGLAYTMARNLCVSMYRRQTTGVVTGGGLPDVSHNQTPAVHAIEADNQRLLALAMAKLPPAWQRLIRMQAETDMTTRQMAEVLGVKPESVSAMLSAARRRLRELLLRML